MKAFFASRMVRLTLLLLLGLNLGVFAVSYRFVTQVEANYSRLLEEGIPLLNHMQTATVQTSQAYALLVDLSRAGDEQETDRLLAELDTLRKVADAIFQSPEVERTLPPAMVPAFGEIRQTRQRGKITTETYLALARQRDPSAAAFLSREIHPIYRAYIKQLDTFCNEYETSFMATYRQMAGQNARHRSIFLGLSAAPLALLGGIAISALLAIIVCLTLATLPDSARPRANS
jgi:hypothetical protein